MVAQGWPPGGRLRTLALMTQIKAIETVAISERLRPPSMPRIKIPLSSPKATLALGVAKSRLPQLRLQKPI